MSRFVSGGTNDSPTERDEAWLQAQTALDAKTFAAKQQEQEGGKSLYETLQANKAAKQEAFEESIRLRNQFRSLDEDEVEFLDEVREGERRREREERREVEREVLGFRRLQEEAVGLARGGEDEGREGEKEGEAGEVWSVGGGRKRRRRTSGREIGGLGKMRRVSSSAGAGDGDKKVVETRLSVVEDEKVKSSGVKESSDHLLSKPDIPRATAVEAQVNSTTQPVSAAKTGSTRPAAGLGLGAYSSDEDD